LDKGAISSGLQKPPQFPATNSLDTPKLPLGQARS
jgi:hypothetical protein